MKTPESYFQSQRDHNLLALSSHIGQPVVIMDMEDGHILVQYGELESYTDQHMALKGTFHDPTATIPYKIPEDEVVIAGHDNIHRYAQELLARFEQEGELATGAVAATILNRFAAEEERASIDALCAEIARAVIDSSSVDDTDVACVLDAPRALQQPVFNELHRRIRMYMTLHDIQRDRLLMAFVAHIATVDQISELEAISHITQATP